MMALYSVKLKPKQYRFHLYRQTTCDTDTNQVGSSLRWPKENVFWLVESRMSAPIATKE